MNGSVPETAAVLANAVESGGYDGVFLDIAKLNGDREEALTRVIRALKAALGDKLLYLAVEAPSWQGTAYTGYDYETLGKSVDRMVLRITSYEKTSGGFPTAPVEPLEELYYALGEMEGKVDTGKLSVLLTTTGSSWNSGRKGGSMSGTEIEEVLADKETETYYSNRYACAYLNST